MTIAALRALLDQELPDVRQHRPDGNDSMICATCPRLIPDDCDAYACQACEHRMRHLLATIVTELPLLQAALVPGGGTAGGRPAGRAHAPLPVNVRALDMLGPGTIAPVPDPHGEQSAGIPLGPLLVGWARYIATTYPAVYRAGGTEYVVPAERAEVRSGTGIPAWCGWLTRYLPYAVRQPWIAQLSDQLDDAVHRVRAITGTRPRTHPRLAPCPACSMVAMARTDGVWEIVCEACGHRMDPDAYDAHAAAVLPGLAIVMARMAAAELTAGAA